MEILADLAFSTEVPRRKSANFLFSLVDPLKLEGFHDALRNDPGPGNSELSDLNTADTGFHFSQTPDPAGSNEVQGNQIYDQGVETNPQKAQQEGSKQEWGEDAMEVQQERGRQEQQQEEEEEMMMMEEESIHQSISTTVDKKMRRKKNEQEL